MLFFFGRGSTFRSDKGPDGGGFTCKTGSLQNYHCPAFFDCNYTTGQCLLTNTPGEGHYPTMEECNPHCFNQPMERKLYKCNVSNPEKYTCDVCKDGVDHCSPQDEACSQCKAPPPKKYVVVLDSSELVELDSCQLRDFSSN